MKVKLCSKEILINFIYFLFVIGFFRGTALSGFEMFSGLHVLDQIFTLFQYIGMVYILIAFFLYYRKITAYDILLYVFLIIILISTALSGVELNEALNFTEKIFFVVLWFKTIYKMNNIMRLKAFVNGLNILQCINLVFMLIFYGGAQYANSDTVMGTVGHVYLLGYDNGLLMYALPTVVLNYYLFSKEKNILYKIFIVIVSSQVIISGSVTGIIALLLTFLFFNYEFLAKIFSGIRGIVLSVVVFVGLATMTIQQWISPLLNSLDKGLTLSGRTEIWQWALSYIKNSKMIGYGYSTERARNVFFWKLGITAAHSQLLDLLLQGGVVCLVIYIILYISSQRQSLKIYKETKKSFWKLLFVVEMVFFFVMIVESYSSYAAYPLLFVLFEMGRISKKNKIV